MKKFASIAASAVMAGTMFAAPAHANTGESVGLIGDSLSFRASWAMPPHWNIDAIGGSKVNTLPSRQADMVDAMGGYPDHMILYLGTNPVENWNKQNFINVVDRVPTSSQVYLMTYYRGPKWGDEEIMPIYSDWINEIASTRPNVNVMKWRWHVMRGAVQLSDGIHAQPGPGEQFFADRVAEQVAANGG